MRPAKITLTREELYNKAWTTPIHKLSKEFGLSDVGLAKVCRRHQIPIPGRGYWARLQAGQSPKRTPLPAPADVRLTTIEIFPSEPRPVARDADTEGLPIPTILVAENRPLTHPLALRIDKFILRTKMDERGLVLPRRGKVPPIRVSLEALPRSLRILDALLAAMGEVNYTLKWPSPYDKPLIVQVLDEELPFSISEVVEHSEHKPTREEIIRQKLESWWRPPKWDYKPTGRLKLTIDCSDYLGVRRAWSDGKKRRVEDCLGHFMVALVLVSKALKRQREESAERERRWAEERKREAEEAARKTEYERKAKVIDKFAGSWRHSKLLRDFARELSAEAERAEVPADQKQDLCALADWTLRHAEAVDPLRCLSWVIREFKHPSREYY